MYSFYVKFSTDDKLTELMNPYCCWNTVSYSKNYAGVSISNYKSFLSENDVLSLQLTANLGYELLSQARNQKPAANICLMAFSRNGARPSDEAPEAEVSHEPCLPYEIDSTEDIPEPIPLVRQVDGGAPILTRGGLSLILGYAKSRKTFLVSALAAVALGKENLGLEASEKGYKVAVCDTEEGRYFASKVKRRIQTLMGWDTKQNQRRFKYFDLRNMGVEDRLQTIEKIAGDFQPDILFIDGILDCCLDYNSSKETDHTINVLLHLSAKYDMHICTVLHTNKDKTTAKGHLGSIVLAKVETGMEIVSQRDMSEVKPAANSCRHLPFTPFCFGIDVNGLPYLIGTVASRKKRLFEKIKDDLKDLFDNSTDGSLKRKDILDVITKDDRVSLERARKSVLRELVEDGFLEKNEGKFGYYTLGQQPSSS